MPSSQNKEITSSDRIKRIFGILRLDGREVEVHLPQYIEVAKIFYFLLQVAHAINQLILKGSLLRAYRKQLGTLKNYRRRLGDAFRKVIPPDAWNPDAARAMQIRFT